MIRVRVHKAGEIILKLSYRSRLNSKKTQEPFKMIKTCPVCDAPLERKDGEADHYCTNDQCPGKHINRLIPFSSRVGEWIIDTLGEKVGLKQINMNLKGDF